MSERYNDKGEKLIKIDGVWVAEKYLPTEEEIAIDEKRFLKPKVNWGIFFIHLLLIIFFSCCLFVLFDTMKISEYRFLIWILIAFYIMLWLKRFSIFLIKIYQKYAPSKLRRRCLFKPTCSQYTILSIEKYGLIKGSILGLKRIKRCKYPNGGVDYP